MLCLQCRVSMGFTGAKARDPVRGGQVPLPRMLGSGSRRGCVTAPLQDHLLSLEVPLGASKAAQSPS